MSVCACELCNSERNATGASNYVNARLSYKYLCPNGGILSWVYVKLSGCLYVQSFNYNDGHAPMAGAPKSMLRSDRLARRTSVLRMNPVLRLASNGGKILRLLLLLLLGALLLQLLHVLLSLLMRMLLLLLPLLQLQLLLLLLLLLLGQSSHCGLVIINIPPVCDRNLPLVGLKSAYAAGTYTYK